MDSPRPTNLFSSVSRLFLTSAQLARKQAEITKIKTVTLPRLYYQIGKHIAELETLPPELALLDERIKNLKPAAETASPVGHSPATSRPDGITAYAQSMATQVTRKIFRRAADAKAAVQAHAGYFTLGRRAIADCGSKAVPKELRAELSAAELRLTALTSDIADMQGRDAVGFLSLRRVVVTAGSIVGILLVLFVLRSVGGVATASRHSGTARKGHLSTVDGLKKLPPVAKSNGGGILKPAGEAPKNTAVEIAIGATSQTYQPHGFKGVELGSSFDALHREKPFYWKAHGYACNFQNDESNNFIFNDKNVLVCYVQSYHGGIDAYLEQIIGIFGKTTKETRTNVLRKPGVTKTSSFIDYAFPEVLVEVQFITVTNENGEDTQTHVVVLDRNWAERLLNANLAIKESCMEWMEAAMVPASNKDWTMANAPALKGTTPHATQHGINFYDEKGLERLTRAQKTASEESLRIQAQCGWYGPAPAIVCDFSKRDDMARQSSLKNSLADTDQYFEFLNAVTSTPYLSDLDEQTTVILMQEHFPPRTDKIRVTRNEGNAFQPTVYEWETDHPTGRWIVRCLSNGSVEIVLTDVKKL